MKSLTKRIGVLATVFAMVVLNILGSFFILGNKAYAGTATNEPNEYF